MVPGNSVAHAPSLSKFQAGNHVFSLERLILIVSETPAQSVAASLWDVVQYLLPDMESRPWSLSVGFLRGFGVSFLSQNVIILGIYVHACEAEHQRIIRTH